MQNYFYFYGNQLCKEWIFSLTQKSWVSELHKTSAESMSPAAKIFFWGAQNNKIFLFPQVVWKKCWPLEGSLECSFTQPIPVSPTFADGTMEEKPLCFLETRVCTCCEWPPSYTQRRGTLQGDVAQLGSHSRLATGLGAEPCPPKQQKHTWSSDLHEVPHLELCRSTTSARPTILLPSFDAL